MPVVAEFPESVRMLFWDVDPDGVRLDEHSDYVLERVMSRGRWDAMCWLRRTYDMAVVADFLERKGKLLAPRERAYWSLIASVDVPPERGGGTPTWTHE
jgi:hypothetical protein